ncbi:hypothetical protein PRIC1_003837 [Phytophthora ramorum]
MDWGVAVRRIAATRGQTGTSIAEFRTLLELVDHDDVLVAYAAKEELNNVLTGDEMKDAIEVVEAITTVSTTSWRRDAGGFRFQLLQQLLKTQAAQRCDSGRDVEYPYLKAVLNNLQHVGGMVCDVLVPEVCSEDGEDCSAGVPYSVRYEALLFLSDFMKRLRSLEHVEVSQSVELNKHMKMLMNNAFMTMDYASQPTFVSCAVQSLLGDFQELMVSWKEQTQDEDNDDVKAMYLQWLDMSLLWLTHSSCTYVAVRLLNMNESSNVASQEAFIGQSSRYPFLQQWLLCLSRIGVAFLEALPTRAISACEKPGAMNLASGACAWSDVQLPRRQQLFAVLSEQDDVMIEVLNGLTRMAALADAGSEVPDCLDQQGLAWPPHIREHFAAEYDPDLLFADLMGTLEGDHVVLLDLLVSNETKMLEYTMRYLRHLSADWNSSKQKLQTADRLECTMSVLIRLRLEIDRLVAADLFPYRAGPLTRRLLVIEQLYEEPSEARNDAEQL